MTPDPICPCCLSDAPKEVVVRREAVPVLQNVIVRSQAAARAFPAHKLDYRFCANCGFIWNAAFAAERIAYDDSYNNDVQASGYYLQHQRLMARKVLTALPASGAGLVEIGCGSGDFLRVMLEEGDARIGAVVGFDPAWPGADLDPRVMVHKRYFEMSQTDLFPAETHAIVSRHTIEHIPEPRPFIASLAEASRQRGVDLFLETPDVRWILANTAFEDWFYEHCSLFSPASISRLLAEHGMRSETGAVYGGQYQWTRAEAGPGAAEDMVAELAGLVAGYRQSAADLLGTWRARLAELCRDGPVAIWGAASKGVTFTLLMNEEAPLVSMGVDLNTAKQGCFMPVTGVPIVSPESAKAEGVRHVVVMNPNYLAEISAQIRDMGWPAQVISLREG